jgi:hypothetical protein
VRAETSWGRGKPSLAYTPWELLGIICPLEARGAELRAPPAAGMSLGSRFVQKSLGGLSIVVTGVSPAVPAQAAPLCVAPGGHAQERSSSRPLLLSLVLRKDSRLDD